LTSLFMAPKDSARVKVESGHHASTGTRVARLIRYQIIGAIGAEGTHVTQRSLCQ